MKSIILSKATQRVLVLLLLIVCLLFMQRPLRASVSSCQEACTEAYQGCMTDNCNPAHGFQACVHVCKNKLNLCVAACR